MKKELKKVDSHRRLLQALEIISLHTNLSYRIAKRNAYENLLALWEKEKAPLSSLQNIIDGYDWKKGNLDIKIEPELWKWFYPLWDYELLSVDQRERRRILEEKIQFSIWKTRSILGNPLHDALSQVIPFVRVFSRIQTISLLKSSDTLNEAQTIRNPTMLTRGIKKIDKIDSLGLEKNDVLFVGAVWLYEDLEKIDTDIWELKPEEYFRMRLEELIKFSPLNKEHFRIKLDVDFKDYSTLFVMVGMHQVMKMPEVFYHINHVTKILNKLNNISLKLLSQIEDKVLVSIHSSEWQSLTEFILFLCDDKTNFLYNKLIKKYSKENLFVTWKLASPADRSIIIKAEPVFNDNTEDNELLEWSFYENITYEKRELPNELILNESISRESYKLNQYFRDYLSKIRVSRSNLERIEYERLRSYLIILSEDDVSKRYELICESLRKLVLADKAIFFEYNGLTDILIPLVLIRDQIISLEDFEKEKIERDKAITHLKNVFANISDYLPECTRDNSSAYHSLDNINLCSRFIGKDNNFNPFASKVKNTVKTISRELSAYFHDEEDLLSIPIIVHGRIQGVVHLSSVLSHQFKLEDRLSLLRFLQMFEEEIYKSKSVEFFKESHDLIGKAIMTEILEDDFLSQLCRNLAKLTGANGISLWLCPKPGERDIYLKCAVGEKLRPALGKGTMADLLLEPFFKNIGNNPIKVFNNKNEFSGIGNEIFTTGLEYCISSTMKDKGNNLYGILMIHDSRKLPQSKIFFDEFIYLTKEIQQLLLYYYEHQRQIETIKLGYVHDISSSVTRIKDIASRLKNFTPFMFIEKNRRNNFEKKIEDIEEHCGLAHDILKYLTSGNISNININMPSKLLRLHHHFDQSQFIKILLFEIIKSIIHAKSNSFYDKHIEFNLPSDRLTSIILDKDILTRIIQNIVDNAAKYSEQNSIFDVSIKKTIVDIQILFNSKGIKLDKEAKKNQDIIFEKGSRNFDDNNNIYEGSGLGLYISKELAQSFGGYLWLEYFEETSRTGNYTFILSIPLRYSEEIFEKLKRG